MGYSITQKLLKAHLLEGTLEPGGEIGIRIDQTLTQDATGTMAYLQFEAMGISRVKTELSVSYVDHNTLQTGFESADDHKFLQGMAARHGAYFSRPGNGICHQVHLERFGVPGKTMLGSDSHTPTGGGLGMFAVGVGGLDVAVAMGGGPFYLRVPKVVNIQLHGRLKPWVVAKDIILEVLRLLSVKGGVGKVLEYGGDGVANLSVPERATITNMGAETGATTSVFPSDDITWQFLRAQGREKVWVELLADPDAAYDEVIHIDLGGLEPLVAQPHMPDNVVTVSAIKDLKVDQIMIGSCTNSSYLDLMRAAAILKGKVVHPEVSLVIAPGSRQVLTLLAKNGALTDLVQSGARILESACGPCIGMGQAPASGAVSLRTNNRNFAGRSGTKDARVYLVSPETAAAAAITGVITDPRVLEDYPEIELPQDFAADDSLVIPPGDTDVEVVRGPNIKALPVAKPLPVNLSGEILLKVSDNITTDHIMPAGSKVLPFRSNIPAMSKFAFEPIDPTFPERASAAGGGIIVGGENYGQGSSREHAALVPMYLGVKAVIAKSFARIHRDNLINFGILPLTFAHAEDYDRLDLGDSLEIPEVAGTLAKGLEIKVKNLAKGYEFVAVAGMTDRQIAILRAGGLLNFTKENS
ncbi:MAG: aconitate hydratase [Desulfitobacteriaceae bacterium]|nr:aconitate hydratase [Desulfitobacteriaceae bacterium]MDI6880557.1 aconitate hydratase [Desulfitobacteriaceae bacterium]MDI6914627.1 aconitate hydratase [Desulfitobacteriaceae bacterium]